MKKNNPWSQCPVDISDDDIMEAMKDINGYLDITPGDFREIYTVAYIQAMARINKNVKAGDIMTSPVVTILEDAALIEAAELMAKHSISGLPVMGKDQRIAGVVSETDYLKTMGERRGQSFMHVIVHCLKNKGCMAVPLRSGKVGDIMTSPPLLVQEDTSVFEIANLLEIKQINRVPVIDKQSNIVGIVTRTDIVQSYCMKSS
jgi:CBS-domain-containing membrane protein